MRIIFIRHGKTPGNTLGRYIGSTDEPLCREGAEEIKGRAYPAAQRIIASPMKRCRETAELIYGSQIEIFSDLRECDFGSFENKSYEELKNDPDYRLWIETEGEAAPPRGESKADFSERCCRCFGGIVLREREKDITMAFVVHGGTIMALTERYLGCAFYEKQLKNGEYLICDCVTEKGVIRLKQRE